LPGLLKFNDSRGYRAVELQTGQIKKRFTVHRLVMLSFIGPRPYRMQINHINGIKTDNRVINLEYVTASENQKHSFRLGLQSNVGEKHSRAKLTDARVMEIRGMIASGMKQKEIAKLMGVTQSAISYANSGRRWSHLKMPNEIKVLQ
jgi:hypothetical protein